MRARITLQITADDGTSGAIEEVALLIKATEGAEDLGLSLIEGKALLGAIQGRLVQSQVEAWAQGRRRCEGCGRRRRSKGSAPIAFRTLFGDVPLGPPAAAPLRVRGRQRTGDLLAPDQAPARPCRP